MRYSRTESTYILAVFDSGDTVTIDIYDLDTDSKVVDGASCSEVGTTGVFKYLFSQTITGKKEYLWIMSNGSYSRMGKIVLGGWMDSIPDDVDSKLSSTHGSGSWEGTSPADVWSYSERKLTHSELTAEGKHIASEEALEQHDADIKAKLEEIEGEVEEDNAEFEI